MVSSLCREWEEEQYVGGMIKRPQFLVCIVYVQYRVYAAYIQYTGFGCGYSGCFCVSRILAEVLSLTLCDDSKSDYLIIMVHTDT